jgi:hypothetical protein
VLYLQRKEQADGLDPLPPPVHVVPQEEVAGLGGQASVFEQSQHVVVLSVDVSADLDWGGDREEHGLFEEDGLDDPDEAEDVCFPEGD